jgi:hypothetical protein
VDQEGNPVADFNLQTLYNFRPARFLCAKCRALLVVAPSGKGKDKNPRCPVCAVEYVPTTDYPGYRVGEFLTAYGHGVKFNDLLRHCMGLAEAVSVNDFIYGPKEPLRMLLDALNQAQQFVHFASYGISEFFIGALKLVAQRVPVRGIVSNVDGERTLDELTSFKGDVPVGRLEIKPFLRGEPWDEFPHQKLIVIDGLLAFKGTANLTLIGWRKAARGRDHIEPVTKVNEVIELHNTLFSPVWAVRGNTYGPSIEMSDDF